jgi:hypothetical protein
VEKRRKIDNYKKEKMNRERTRQMDKENNK